MKKKMKSVRGAVVMTIATLLTTCLIGGAFAKYATGAESSDRARVAYWGFSSANTISIDDLFSKEYANVHSRNDDDVIAPGTEGQASFRFAFDGNGAAAAPEVAYTFSVSVEESCDAPIKENDNIRFRLDNGSYGTWDELVSSLKALAGQAGGTKVYAAGTLPAAFSAGNDTHTISWKWIFQSGTGQAAALQDEKDTAMGNAETPAACSLKITVTAVQVD